MPILTTVSKNTSIDSMICSRDSKKILKGKSIYSEIEENMEGLNLLQTSSIDHGHEKIQEFISLGETSNKINGLRKILIKNDLESYGLKMKEFITDSKNNNDSINNNYNNNNNRSKERITDENEIKNCISLINDYIIYENLEEACKLINKYIDILMYENDSKLNILSQLIIMINNENDKKQFIKVIKNCSVILNDENSMLNKINHTTPLHYLIKKLDKNKDNNKNCLEILSAILKRINNKKILDIKDNNNMTVLDYAIYKNNINAIKMLYKRNKELQQLQPLIMNSNVIHMQYALLNENPTLDILDNMIKGVLHIINKNKYFMRKTRKEKEKENEIRIAFENIINDNSINNGQSLLHIASYL
eukprot:jgi/Orpsp1_1/1183373/evm.model.c7180000084891.1